MYQSEIENVIISKVKSLNSDQKNNVLDYLQHIPKQKHSTKIYRRKAMKQIRDALNNQV